ncbi:MAG TPA: hypothetical protein VGX48_18735 [Pyrinomonadaceae bacterium]|jgi:hypothetical protein|nr:hypothetical protein [Pyrinomonadaceae bacterium]
MFRTALEVLRDNAAEMVAHAKYEGEPYSDEAQKRMEEKHAPLTEALASFDDALQAAVAARNEFVEALDLEADFILFNHSKAKVR